MNDAFLNGKRFADEDDVTAKKSDGRNHRSRSRQPSRSRSRNRSRRSSAFVFVSIFFHSKIHVIDRQEVIDHQGCLLVVSERTLDEFSLLFLF